MLVYRANWASQPDLDRGEGADLLDGTAEALQVVGKMALADAEGAAICSLRTACAIADDQHS